MSKRSRYNIEEVSLLYTMLNPAILAVFVRRLAIQSVSAPPRGMGRDGGLHNQQNAWSHAVPSCDRRLLSIADNPEDSDYGKNIFVFSNGFFRFVQSGAPHSTSQHTRGRSSWSRDLERFSRGMGIESWGHN